MKEIRNKAYSLFKDNFNITIKFSAFISLFLIVIYFILFLILNYAISYNLTGIILVYILIYIFTLIVTPYFYSFYANNGILCAKDLRVNKEVVNMVSFLGTRKIGAMKPFKNAQGVFFKLLIAYIISALIQIVVIIIALIIGYSLKNENGIYGFIEEAESIKGSLSFSYDFSNLLGKYNSSLRIVSGISSFIAVSCGFYYFLHNFARSFLNYLYISPNDSMPPRYISRLIKKTLKDEKCDYNKVYSYIMWPYYLLSFILFTAIYLLLYFLLKDLSVVAISLTAMIIVVFILLPFLPVLLNLNNLKRDEIIPLLFKEINSQLTIAFEEAKKSNQFSEEELKTLDEKIKESNDNFEKLLKENEEEKENKENNDKEKKD